MNYDKLQKEYLQRKDMDRLLFWASENKTASDTLMIDKAAQSYFEKDRGDFYGNIEEYNCSNVENIGNEVFRITQNCGFLEKDILARITAITMFKLQPREVAIRERYLQYSKDSWKRKDTNTAVSKDGLTASDKAAYADINKIAVRTIGTEPPEFFYPM